MSEWPVVDFRMQERSCWGTSDLISLLISNKEFVCVSLKSASCTSQTGSADSHTMCKSVMTLLCSQQGMSTASASKDFSQDSTSGCYAPFSMLWVVIFPHRPMQTCSLLLTRYNDALWCFQLLAGLFGCWFFSFKHGHDAFIHRGVSQSWQLWYNLLPFACVVSNPHAVISYTEHLTDVTL